MRRGETTLALLAADFGVTRERIRQIEVNAMRRIRMVRWYLQREVRSSGSMALVAHREGLPLQVVFDYVTLPIPEDDSHEANWPWSEMDLHCPGVYWGEEAAE